MDASDWLWALAGLMTAASGIYIMLRPRRLFMFYDDPAEYRPEAVEYESHHGRVLRKAAPIYVLAGLVLIAVAIL